MSERNLFCLVLTILGTVNFNTFSNYRNNDYIKHSVHSFSPKGITESSGRLICDVLC